MSHAIEHPSAERQQIVQRVNDSADREQVQPLAEQQQQHQAQPEDRQRIQEQRDVRQRGVRRAARARGLINADRQPQQEFDGEGGDPQNQGVGNGVAQGIGHRPVLAE